MADSPTCAPPTGCYMIDKPSPAHDPTTFACATKEHSNTSTGGVPPQGAKAHPGWACSGKPWP
eukprot:843828-Pelagomonas_calceolata.AAC.4